MVIDGRASAAPAAAGACAIALATSLPTLCPFRLWSGHACPLCGMTRAVGSLARGDAAVAFQLHPMVFIVLVEILIVALIFSRADRWPVSPETKRALAAANVLGFLVLWLARWRLDLLSFVVT